MSYELPNYPNHPAFQGFAGLSGEIPMRNTTGYRGLGKSYVREAMQYGDVTADIPVGPNLVTAQTVTPGGSPAAPMAIADNTGGTGGSPSIPNLSGDTTALPAGMRFGLFVARCGLGYYMGTQLVKSSEHKQMYGVIGALINGFLMDGIVATGGLTAMAHFGGRTLCPPCSSPQFPRPWPGRWAQRNCSLTWRRHWPASSTRPQQPERPRPPV